MQSTQKRAFLYCRAATDNAVTEQKQKLLDYAEEHGYEVVKVFEESSKARYDKRVEIKELLKETENGTTDAVLIQDASRLVRNALELFAIACNLKARGVKLILLHGGEVIDITK
jgi:DNA invertase Pin-like site-specific DNA recombinase